MRTFWIIGLLCWCLLCSPLPGIAEEDPFAELEAEGDPFAGLAMEEQSDPESRDSWFANGYFESRNQLALRNQYAISNRARLWLNLESERKTFRWFIDGYGSSEFVETEEGNDRTATINEAYITWDSEWLDFVAGRKIVTWGVTSGLSTMDEINPVDPNDPIASARSGNKIPVWLANLQLDLKWSVLNLLYLPYAENTALADPGNPWELETLKEIRQLEKEGQLELEDEQRPDDMEWGFRWDFYLTNLELGFVYFNGYENTPFLVSENSNGLLTVTPTYYEWQGYGFYLTTPGDRSALRMEIAYKPDFPFWDKKSELNRKNYLQLIAGIENSFLTNLNTNLQVYFYSITSEKKDEIENPVRHGISYYIGNTFCDDTLKLGFQGIFNTYDSSSFNELFGEYKYQDSITLLFGVMDFEGDKDTYYGEMDQNDLIYFTLQYFFSLH